MQNVAAGSSFSASGDLAMRIVRSCPHLCAVIKVINETKLRSLGKIYN